LAAAEARRTAIPSTATTNEMMMEADSFAGAVTAAAAESRRTDRAEAVVALS
jgi:hypothetical protein